MSTIWIILIIILAIILAPAILATIGAFVA